jgi:hypothetical protein
MAKRVIERERREEIKEEEEGGFHSIADISFGFCNI